MKQYLLNTLLALDRLLNAMRGGSPHEYLSSAAWRTEKAGKLGGQIFRPVIDFLFSAFEKDHCQKSFMSDLEYRK